MICSNSPIGSIRLKTLCWFNLFRDDAVMKTATGVLGDLADTLGPSAGSMIQQFPLWRELLNEGLSSDDPSIKQSAEWAKLALGRVVSI